MVFLLAGSEHIKEDHGEYALQELLKLRLLKDAGEGLVASTPTVVCKVKEWMDKNINQLTVVGGGGSSIELEAEDPKSPPLDAISKQSLEQTPIPPIQELPDYCRTGKGSIHIQSILITVNPQLGSHVLSALVTGSPGPLSLMTSPKSSYIIQKLITISPSPQLEPLLTILSQFPQLSLDSSWYRVVQTMLEFSNCDQVALQQQDPSHLGLHQALNLRWPGLRVSTSGDLRRWLKGVTSLFMLEDGGSSLRMFRR